MSITHKSATLTHSLTCFSFPTWQLYIVAQLLPLRCFGVMNREILVRGGCLSDFAAIFYCAAAYRLAAFAAVSKEGCMVS